MHIYGQKQKLQDFLNSLRTGYIDSKAVYISSRTLTPVSTIFPETNIKRTILGLTIR